MSSDVAAFFQILRRSEREAREANETAEGMRKELGKITGHSYNRAQNACECGYRAPGYPSDQKRLTGAHILREWEKAASA